MKIKQTPKKLSSPTEIDQLVIAQAEDDSAWESPIHVRQMTLTSLSLPAELAARIAFVARLHRNNNVEAWLLHVIQERLEVEERIYGEVRRELMSKLFLSGETKNETWN